MTFNQTPLVAILVGITTITANSTAQETASKAETKVVLVSEVDWQQLNPARGDKSPQAATLWGDRNGKEATGFLAKFVDGFSSPPHIHNVSYRAVVIAGGIHNDDPNATPMWMPPGSFWTQPAGEVHITASQGAGIALVEIDSGPYLVLPEDKANDNGERPVNIVPSNIVWLDAMSTSWVAPPVRKTSHAARIAFLWGVHKDGQLNGSFVRLPTGFNGDIRSLGESFQAVVIEGQAILRLSGNARSSSLTPGSYVASQGVVAHRISCSEQIGCVIYVRNKGRFEVTSQ